MAEESFYEDLEIDDDIMNKTSLEGMRYYCCWPSSFTHVLIAIACQTF